MRIQLPANKKIPDHWTKVARVPIDEFRAWRDGNEKKEPTGPKLRRNRRQDFATLRDGVLTITIHELPPSQNDWKKWHWSVLAEETKRWNELVCYLAKSTGAGQFKNPVIKFRFFFPDGRERDRKNFESWKPLLDGLTWAGVIADDNYKVIKEDKSDIEIDRGNPRVEIVIREVED